MAHSRPIDVVQAALSAKELLEGAKNRFDLTGLPDNAVRLVIKGKPKEMLKIAFMMFFVAGLGSAVGYALERFPLSPDFQGPIIEHPQNLFNLMSLAIAGIGALLILIFVVAGSERDTILDVGDSRIRVDRYVAGDHMVREYLSTEIQAIAVQETSIILATKTHEIGFGSHLTDAERRAIVAIICLGLWQDNARLGENIRIGKILRKHFALAGFDYRLIEKSPEAEADQPKA